MEVKDNGIKIGKILKALLFSGIMMGLYMFVQLISVCLSVGFSAGYAIYRAMLGDEYYLKHSIMEFATGKDGMMLASLVSTIACAVVFGFWWLIRNRNYGMAKVRIKKGFKALFKYFIYLIILFIAFYGITEYIFMAEAVMFPKQLEEYAKISESLVFDNVVINIVVLSLLGPLAEECLFRGIIFDRLKRCMNIYVAIAVQALLFGLMHGNLIQTIFTIPVGIACGLVSAKFDSVIPAIFLHSLYNGFSLVLSYLPTKLTNTAEFSGMLILVPLFAIGFLFTKLPRDDYGQIDLRL